MEKNDLLGCLLGDGYISPRGNFVIRHSCKQREYLEFKYKLCKGLYSGRDFNIIDVPSQNGVQFSVSDACTFKRWRELYYPNGEKRITREWLNELTKLAIALWFCDDGSTYFKKHDGKTVAIECVISTCCPESEADLVIAYFADVWNVKMSKKKDKRWFSVRFGTKEGRNFMGIFGHLFPECMNYKVSKFDGFAGDYCFF